MEFIYMKKVMKKILIVIAILFAIFVGLVVFEVVKQLKEESTLKKEIINYANKDFAKDEFPITVTTTGDCAYIEEAIKKYYKEISENVKKINFYLNEERLNSLLSIESLRNDRPSYQKTHEVITKTKQKINSSMTALKELCTEEKIKNLIDKEKFDDPEYYYDLYLQLMYTEQDLEDLKYIKDEMETLSKTLNDSLDKLDEMITFLQNHDNYVVYEENSFYFTDDQLLAEYNKLIQEFEQIAGSSEELEDDNNLNV